MTDIKYSELHKLYAVMHPPSMTATTTLSIEVCCVIEDGEIRRVTAKELAIEEIKAQPFYV